MKTTYIFLLLAVTMSACSRGAPSAPPGHDQPQMRAALAAPRVTAVPDQISLPGTVRGTQMAVLTARNGGQVTRVTVEAGVQVDRGAVLVEVDTEDARAALARAGAQLTQAQVDWQQARADEKRFRALLEQGAITKRDYELVKHRYDAARAARSAAQQAVSAARQRLGYAVVRAPFAGVVTERRVDPGDMVSPGAALMTLSGGRPEVRVYAGERVFAAIKQDTPVSVRVAGGDYQAQITQLVNAADPATHTHLIKLTLPSGTLVPSGAYAVAVFTAGMRRALTLPATAVITRAGLTGVLVVDTEGTAHFREVRTAAAADGVVVIAAGVGAGERVVARPTPDMGNGTRIVTDDARD